MLLLSKTVVNHLKTNTFSTIVITFFAGCSAFVQLSTDNIRGIIDSSLAPFASLPKQDMFIKTGKKEPFMGGASFTLPVEIEIVESEGHQSNQKENIEIRYLTPNGWFNLFDGHLARDRLKKTSESKTDYGKDYCVPLLGIRSIYTNYWVRPKVRFKGVWDAQIEGDEGKLKPRDNEKYRKECAEYIEEELIANEFLGKMMWDWVISASTDEGFGKIYKNGISDNKAQQTENSNKGVAIFHQFKVKKHGRKKRTGLNPPPQLKDRVNKEVSAIVPKNSGSNVVATSKEKKEGKLWEKEDRDDKCYSYSQKSKLKWSPSTTEKSNKGCTNNITDKGKNGVEAVEGGPWIYGFAEANKLHELKGRKVDELTGSAYINKYNERQKEKLKMEIEELLMNAEHLDIRKILEEFRKTKGHNIEQVSQENSAEELWTPVWDNPWLDAAEKRKATQKSDESTIRKIFTKYRLLQDNQLLRYNRPKNEESMLKFNVHKSVQLTNTVGSLGSTISQESSGGKATSLIDTTGHTYKVIAHEDRKERGSVNPLRIIRGNPLFTARENQEKLLRDFIAVYDQPFYAPWMIPMLRMISRAKFSGTIVSPKGDEDRETSDVRKTLHWWIDYLQYPWKDRWNIPGIRRDQYDPEKYEKLQSWLKEINEYTWSSNGARIIFNFTAYYKQYLLRPDLFPGLSFLVNNFKMIGYIDQPTSYFAVVSPEYARINGFEPISDEQYKEFRALVNNLWLTQEQWEEAYKRFTEIDLEKNRKNIVNIGDKKMIIVGLGLTPDLLYPVQSWITLQPDKNKEALIYVDNYGFNDLKERGTVKYQEQYATIRLPENIKAQGPEAAKKYMDELKKFIDSKLTGANKNSYFLTLAGEDEGSDQLYSLRNSYIPTFQTRMGAVSYVLSSAVYAVVLILLLILIKKYLQSNMYLFGNFVANGMIKLNVLINICLFTLIPLALATTIGYLLSLAMQSPFYSIISSFWYLGTRMNTLGVGHSLYFILKVLAFMLPISYFYSRWALKENVSTLLKTTASMKVNRLTLIVYRILYKLSAMWKFKSVLVFNTFGQSGILSLTSVIGFLFLNIFLHNHGLFTKVAEAEKTVKTHEYEIDFETPTQESGEYSLATYSKIGKKISVESAGSAGSSATGTSSEEKWIRKSREPEMLKEIYSNYKGYPNWKTEDKKAIEKDKCDDKTKKGKKFAFFKNLFCLEKTIETSGGDGHTRGDSVSHNTGVNNGWKLKTEESRRKKREVNSQTDNKYYSGDQEIYKVNDSESLKSLQELVDDEYPNYWIISPQDQNLAETDMNFFKGKTLMRILLDLDFEYNSDSGFQKFNIWEQKSKELEKIQPMLKKMDEDNYDRFIESLVQSRYGPLFVSKFMKKHDLRAPVAKKTETAKPVASVASVASSSVAGSSGTTAVSTSSTEPDPSKILTRQGERYEGKKSYFFKGTSIGREEQETNIRVKGENKKTCPNQKLVKPKDNNGSNCEQKLKPAPASSGGRTKREASKAEEELRPFEDGLYHVDSSKILFFNEAADVEKDLIIIYNPEFLYLIISAVQEFAKLKEQKMNAEGGAGSLTQNSVDYVVPIKYIFGGIVHSHEPGESKTIQTAGAGSGGGDSEPEYYSASIKNGDKFDPTETPKGDQTYTWTKGKLMSGANTAKVLSGEAKILGLKEDKRGSFYKLYKGKTLLNKKLYSKSNNTEEEPLPILINKFAARLHSLEEGSIIEFIPNNHFTRFTCLLKAEQRESSPRTSSVGDEEFCQREGGSTKKASAGQSPGTKWKNTKIKSHKLKVVGIFDAYYKEAYFMSQKNVNKMIGLNEDKGFNGIFTPNRKSPDGTMVPPDQLSTALSSYSISGFYTDIQHKVGNAALKNLLKQKVPFESKDQEKKKSDSNKAVPQEHRNYKVYEGAIGKTISYDEFVKKKTELNGSSSTEIATEAAEESKADDAVRKLVGRIANVYKEYPSPMNTALLSLMNHNIVGDVVFKNLGNLTDNVSYLVIFVIFPILLMSLITIVYLLIKDLENVFVTMKLLGFGNKENSMPIIVYLLFLLFFSSFVGSLAVPKVLTRYVDLLFNSQSILLPLVLSNGLMAGVFGVLAVIYIFSIIKSYIKIKGIYLPVSIKLLVG